MTRIPLRVVVCAFAAATPLTAQLLTPPFDRPDPFDEHVRTGPALGETIPSFDGIDQNGRRLDFEAIRGPKGAVLLFHRSADW